MDLVEGLIPPYHRIELFHRHSSMWEHRMLQKRLEQQHQGKLQMML